MSRQLLSRRDKDARSREYFQLRFDEMPPLIVLLPPSEGKAPGGRERRTPDRFARQLRTSRDEVRAAIAYLLESGSSDLWSKRFKVKCALLARAVESMRAVSVDTAVTLPAWQRYTGVVWEFLDPSTLDGPQRRSILVPSALSGITTAEDAIADFRLTMNVSLPGIGGLARFWQQEVTEVVRRAARGAQLVDLLPNEHAAAIDFSRLGDVRHVEFLGASSAGAAGHVAKSVKGRFARHLIDHGLEHATAFRFSGWSVKAKGSGFSLVQRH